MLTLLVMIMMLLYTIILKLMLQAFETYCTKQAASSMLLATMEREKELLRVFLKVISMLMMGFDIFCLVPRPEFLLFRQGLNLRAIFSGVSDGEQDPP